MTLKASSKATLEPISWRRESPTQAAGELYYDPELKRNAYVYHRLQVPHALTILERSAIRLSAVSSWTDGYEQWWCEELFSSGPLAEAQAYGMCWSSSAHDEPAWRMVGFQREHPIVRIRAKVEHLLKAACAFVAQNSGSMYLGRVRYRPEGDLQAYADALHSGRLSDLSHTAATLLLHKRNAFRFEREIRLLWLGEQSSGPALHVPFASARITQIMITPHVTAQEDAAIREQLDAHSVPTLSSRILSPPRRPALA